MTDEQIIDFLERIKDNCSDQKLEYIADGRLEHWDYNCHDCVFYDKDLLSECKLLYLLDCLDERPRNWDMTEIVMAVMK